MTLQEHDLSSKAVDPELQSLPQPREVRHNHGIFLHTKILPCPSSSVLCCIQRQRAQQWWLCDTQACRLWNESLSTGEDGKRKMVAMSTKALSGAVWKYPQRQLTMVGNKSKMLLVWAPHCKETLLTDMDMNVLCTSTLRHAPEHLVFQSSSNEVLVSECNTGCIAFYFIDRVIIHNKKVKALVCFF